MSIRIRITKGNGWYEGLEGTVYEVDEIADFVDGTILFVDNEHAVNRRYVYQRHCEVISDEQTPDPNATVENDAVSHPSHYTAGNVEVIDIIAQTVSGYDDPFVAHCVGTATKYLNRAPYKHDNPLEDLRKSKAYIDFAIEHLTKEDEE